jgi:hypothetical protein
VAKKKTVGRRRRGASIPGARGAGAFTKPRGNRSGKGKASRENSAEQERIAKILEERHLLSEIVASVMRGARQDRDVKQETMGYALGRSADAISNMEQVRTDFAFPDVIMSLRALDTDPEYLEAKFKRLLFEVKSFYERRTR